MSIWGLALITTVFGGSFEVPERPADTVIEGDLAKGKTIELGWAAASNVACFPAPSFAEFKGTHQFYRLKIKPSKDMVIRITPSEGTDINFYALLRWEEKNAEPPAITSAWRCEAAYSKPGAETMKLTGYKNDIPVLLGVAGAKADTKGTFKVEVWEEQGRKW
jgi:hypothetical protein